MPIWSLDTFCTLCEQVMDKWGDHALVCGWSASCFPRTPLTKIALRTPLTPPFFVLSGRRMGPSGPAAARRHGISPSAVPFGWAVLSLIRRILLASLLRRKPTRTRSSVRPRNAPRPASPSAHWSSRLWEAGGPMLFVAWIASESRRSGPSTVPTPASRLRSASRAPFRGKTRAQS